MTAGRRRIAALFSVALVAGLIVFLPASLFEDAINRALPPPWKIAVSGTVWQGGGVIRSASTGNAITVPIAWEAQPLAFVRLRLGWNLSSTSPALAGRARVAVGFSTTEIDDADLTADAAAWSGAHPILAVAGLFGALKFTTPGDAKIAIADGATARIEGRLNIVAENFGARLFADPAGAGIAGNYTAELNAKGGAIEYTLRETKGALKFDGKGAMQLSPREANFSGAIAPATALSESALAFLKTNGKPEADGRLRLDWKTRW